MSRFITRQVTFSDSDALVVFCPSNGEQGVWVSTDRRPENLYEVNGSWFRKDLLRAKPEHADLVRRAMEAVRAEGDGHE